MDKLIKSSTFIKSSQEFQECPPESKPEYAFIGRSNVGKSSLINMLARKPKLAKVSSTPGKTQLINHFEINSHWYLVDLPGYGWAQVSKTDKEKWRKMTENYLLQRLNLICVFVLIDSRHEPQKIDLEFMGWLGENHIPFAMIFTKTDKLKNKQRSQNSKMYNQTMSETWEEIPKQFFSSAKLGEGRKEIVEYIENLNCMNEGFSEKTDLLK